MLGGVQYKKIDDEGLHIEVGDEKRILKVDNIVLCAGQYSDRTLYDTFSIQDKRAAHLIGGAFKSEEIDAKRAINQGVRLAFSI
jgi:2,4-dienoyl-CoA reductase (NADPH2)